MNDKEKNDLFYVCFLIEFLGRKTKNRRSEVVKILGINELKRQLSLAEVNHCLSFDEVVEESYLLNNKMLNTSLLHMDMDIIMVQLNLLRIIVKQK